MRTPGSLLSALFTFMEDSLDEGNDVIYLLGLLDPVTIPAGTGVLSDLDFFTVLYADEGFLK
jgi:hypothetical protein